ncbi:hypothetical protein PED39_07255 [Methanomassiliicoccales archaeon LGM-RCC1]|nr:hypothetical protein PED39_07255 [Methanomassiliicoccales archaeon LGM-RCC1]
MDKKTMIVIAVVAVVAVAGIAAYFVMSGNGGGDSDDDGKLVGKILKESEYPSKSSRLWVYGNANEDDKLDNSDVTYLEGIISGKNKATVLADANADGNIDSKDVAYVKSIINAKANTKLAVYYVDNYHQISAVHWPVNSIAIGFSSGAYLADLTGLIDKVGMVDDTILKKNWYKINDKYGTLPSFGWEEEPDLENVLEYKIDVYVPGYCYTITDKDTRKFFEGTSTDCMYMNTCDKDGGGDDSAKEDIDRSIVMFAFLLQGDMDRTYEYLAWHDEVLNDIQKAVANITEADKVPYIMFRDSPKYVETGIYTIAGKGNTCTYHGEFAKALVPGQNLELKDVYNKLDEDAIYEIVRKYAKDGQMYIIYNENDGLRQDKQLIPGIKSIAEMMKNSGVTIKYLGMARETCNSGLYLAETAFYLNMLYPECSGDIDYKEIFDYYYEHFVTKDLSDLIDMDHFFLEEIPN